MKEQLSTYYFRKAIDTASISSGLYHNCGIWWINHVLI
jgi:hypothetical protein